MIAPLIPPLVHVTDHATVRYLARVEGQNIELTRAAIAARVERGFTAARKIGLETCAIVTPEAVYQIIDGKVVTVLSPDRPLSQRWHVIRDDAP